MLKSPLRSALSLLYKIPFKRDWLWILVIFLCVRVVISGIAVTTMWHADPAPPTWMRPTDPGYPTLLKIPPDNQAARVLLGAWYRWDTAWFMQVADSGYSPWDASLSFMPLYPLFIRIAQGGFAGQPLTSTLLAALLVSNLFCIPALILFFEVALMELGSREHAWDALLYLISFPAAFFFFAGYSESLLLTLILATWLFARKGRWPLAALTGALAGLTRLQGLAIAAPLAWQALAVSARADGLTPLQETRAVIRFLGQKTGWIQLTQSWKRPAWLAATFPFIAFFFFTIGSRWVGLTSVISAYSGRASPLAFPWQGFVEFVRRVFSSTYQPADYVDVTLFIALVAVTLLCLPRIRPALTLFSIAMLIMVFSRVLGGGVLPGFMRYVLTTFPFFLGLVKLNLSRPLKVLLVPLFWVAQLLMAWMFVSWLWVA